MGSGDAAMEVEYNFVTAPEWNWDRTWLQHRAQEEEVKPRARQRDQWLRIVGWHMRVLEHRTRQAMRMQVQQAWQPLIGLEGSARAVSGRSFLGLMGKERAGRMAVQDRAMLVLMMEAAAARRRLRSLPGHVH